MNTKVIIGLVVVIIIAGGAYFIWSKGGEAGEYGAQSTGAPSGAQSLSALAAAGTPVTCTYSTTTPAGTTNGTMYIAGGKVAGDFTMQDARAGTITSHMVVIDGTSYVWSSMSNQGFKSTVTNTAQSGAPAQQGVNYNAPMDYSCSPWSVDQTKFDLPANISFMSTATYTAPSQGAGATGAASTGAPKGNAQQCAACASLPSAQKAQCLAALSC